MQNDHVFAVVKKHTLPTVDGLVDPLHDASVGAPLQ